MSISEDLAFQTPGDARDASKFLKIEPRETKFVPLRETSDIDSINMDFKVAHLLYQKMRINLC